MNELISSSEQALIEHAKKYCPEGTEPKAVIHQWLHAIAHNTPLFAESAGVDKKVLLKSLRAQKLYTSRSKFKASLQEGFELLPNENPSFTFIDLFAGIGGMRLGTQQQNGLCVFSSEFDRFAQDTYLTNHGEYPFGDITKIEEENVPKHNLLIAGFPCQPFSYAGLNEGFEDQARGTLFFDILRIIKAKEPEAVLLENVKGFKSHENGKTMDVALNALKAIGYNPTWKVLNSYDYGVPQFRERWYCIATKNDVTFNFPENFDRKSRLKDIVNIEDKDPSLRLSEFEISRIKHHFRSKDIRVKHDNSMYEAHTKKGRHGVFSFQKPDGALRFHIGDIAKTQIQEAFYACLDTYSPTIIANRTPKLWDIERKLSVSESLKLQGFPEGFKFSVSNAQAYKQLGNSVTVPVINELIRKLVKLEII